MSSLTIPPLSSACPSSRSARDRAELLQEAFQAFKRAFVLSAAREDVSSVTAMQLERDSLELREMFARQGLQPPGLPTGLPEGTWPGSRPVTERPALKYQRRAALTRPITRVPLARLEAGDAEFARFGMDVWDGEPFIVTGAMGGWGELPQWPEPETAAAPQARQPFAILPSSPLPAFPFPEHSTQARDRTHARVRGARSCRSGHATCWRSWASSRRESIPRPRSIPTVRCPPRPRSAHPAPVTVPGCRSGSRTHPLLRLSACAMGEQAGKDHNPE